jgi:hypothetical protein
VSERIGFSSTPVIEMSPSISTWSVKTASPSSGSTRFVFKAVEACHESKSAEKLVEKHQSELMEAWNEYFRD